ncbi:MAG: NAD(P)-binding domain-containing protein [Bacteroidia bacterium]|nr:NAD(P)-binding domain-containing protein [Bacteroidia bacterium]MDW8014734.1 NAD(P)-binding domain-containing protein [Bacteroidia bacterium]
MRVALIGAGSWGCAIADLFCQKSHRIYWWVHKPEIAESLRRYGRHPFIFPEHTFPENYIEILSCELEEVLLPAEAVVLALPSRYVIPVLEAHTLPDVPWISCTKGLLSESGLRPSLYFRQRHLTHFAVLSGPSHAEEVIQRRPTWVGLGTSEKEMYEIARTLFETSFFRLLYTPAINSLEWVGTLKNIYAIGIGALSSLGDNARAAVAAVMLAELQEVLAAWVPQETTPFLSPAWAGDFLVTAFSNHSRNQRFGEYLAQGYTPQTALARLGMTAEGYYAAQALKDRVDPTFPILYTIIQVLTGSAPSTLLREKIIKALGEK